MSALYKKDFEADYPDAQVCYETYRERLRIHPNHWTPEDAAMTEPYARAPRMPSRPLKLRGTTDAKYHPAKVFLEPSALLFASLPRIA